MKYKHNFNIKEVVERTSHIGWIEQINLKKLVHCLWNQDDEIFLGRKVIHLIILLECLFIYYDQFQWGFTTNLVGLFKEVQNRASNVEMKDVFLSHGRWEIPWPSSLTYSLNIIDYCVVEVNEDGIEIVNDVEPLNYANHEFV